MDLGRAQIESGARFYFVFNLAFHLPWYRSETIHWLHRALPPPLLGSHVRPWSATRPELATAHGAGADDGHGAVNQALTVSGEQSTRWACGAAKGGRHTSDTY